MKNNKDGMFDLVHIDEDITIGNGKPMKATMQGKFRGRHVAEDGKERKILLECVKVVPELAPYNLFSMTQGIAAGMKLGNHGRTLFLEKQNYKLTFDREIRTKSGYIGAALLRPRTEVAHAAISKNQRVGLQRFHAMLGHHSVEITKKTAEYYGIQLTGKMDTCEDCVIGKARQKNVGKGSEDKRSKIRGERLFMDISSIKTVSYGGAKFWLLIVDDATDMCFSFFIKKKSQVADILVKVINRLKLLNMEPKYIRCDNAGENTTAEKACDDCGSGVKFEYTAPNTPQHNGRVERKFATLYGRIRAMFNAAGIPESMRQGLWAEAAAKATTDENLAVRDTKPAVEKFYDYNKRDKSIYYNRALGDMAVVTKKSAIQGKLVDKGKTVMYLGPAPCHDIDVYRFYNLDTKRVIMSRDVRWLNKTYIEWKKSNDDDVEDPEFTSPEQLAEATNAETIAEDHDDEAGRESADADASDANETSTSRVRFAENAKLIREFNRLDTSYNPVLESGTEETTGMTTRSQTKDAAAIAVVDEFDVISRHLFGDIALFARNDFVEMSEMVETTQQPWLGGATTARQLHNFTVVLNHSFVISTV